LKALKDGLNIALTVVLMAFIAMSLFRIVTFLVQNHSAV
jgi:hypothetical protein